MFIRTRLGTAVLRKITPFALSIVVALGGVAATTPAAAAATQIAFVSEVNADNGTHTFVDSGGTTRSSTQDNFEFLEVANPTNSPIDLADYRINYQSTQLTFESGSPTVVPARGALAVWLRYQAGSANGYSASSPNSLLFEDADFRNHYGMANGTPVAHVTGQAGMANGGDRSLSVLKDGTTLSTTTYAAADVGVELSGHYSGPAEGSTATSLFLPKATPTPGSLTDGQLSAIVPDPEPEDPGVPTQGPPPAVDPDLKAPRLQITEIAPDTSNVSGSDAYEFIEVYNSSQSAISFEDFAVNYLNIDANAVTTNVTIWPASPRDRQIQPGQTLVFWVKLGANAHLTIDDFNREFKAHLTADNLVELQGQGMANGGLRTDLGEHVDAVLLLLHHPVQTTGLALDPLEAGQVALLLGDMRGSKNVFRYTPTLTSSEAFDAWHRH